MAGSIEHVLNEGPRGRSLTLVVGERVSVLSEDHIAFDAVLHELSKADASEEAIVAAIDKGPAAIVVDALGAYTDAASLVGDKVWLAGEPIDDALMRRFIGIARDGDQSDWAVFARFLERFSRNPSRSSRHGLVAWLVQNGVSLASDGRFVAYKGLTLSRTSRQEGTAFVNGAQVTGRIPNEVGSIVSMPRGLVDDTDTQCGPGLHVGKYEGALGFGQGIVATVLVDPVDVVAVPSRELWKMRVCEYYVLAHRSGSEPFDQGVVI